MKQLSAALLLLVASSAGIAQHPASHGQSPPSAPALRGDELEVARVLRAVFAAAENKDLAALDTLFAGDSLTYIEGAGINRGWADYRDNHLGPELKQVQNFRYRPFEITARASGNLAWAMYRYALAGDLPQQKLDHVGRGTAILERRANRWVVRHMQTSSRARRPTDPPIP